MDDEAIIVQVVLRALGPHHEVTTFTSANEALQRIIAGERFDVILCDLMMPQMTGMDLHRQLLGIAADQAERMVFMTGGAFTPEARAFLDQAANLHVEKPIDVRQLRTLVSDRVREKARDV